MARAGTHACGEAAGISPKEIDAVICSTISPDMPPPSCAVYVQRKVGAAKPAQRLTFRRRGGFIYGLAAAEGLCAAACIGTSCCAASKSCRATSTGKDRNTCVLFGDGAGAAILRLCTEEEHEAGLGVQSVHLFADGTQAEALMIPSGGSLYPTSAQTLADGKHFIHMNGRSFTNAVRNLSSSSLDCAVPHGLTPKDVDLVDRAPSQPAYRRSRSRSGWIPPMDKFFINIDRYGNTSSARCRSLSMMKRFDGQSEAAIGCSFCARSGLAWPGVRYRRPLRGARDAQHCLRFSRSGLSGTWAWARRPFDAFPYVRSLFDQADAALGYSLGALFDGPDSQLVRTENTQPAH